MKIYKKVYEDPFRNSDKVAEGASSLLGTPEELADRFRSVIKKADHDIFESVVNFVWLELHFVNNGRRRKSRSSNCIKDDQAFSQFMRRDVGTGHKTLTSNLTFTIITTYLKDFFPDFLDHDPRDEPEYFKFPYKFISLEHLGFVYKVHNRLEMLEYAEEREMKFAVFSNWAVNQVFCYNDEMGKDIYTLTKAGYHWAHINRPDITKEWHKQNLNFNKYEEEGKET